MYRIDPSNNSLIQLTSKRFSELGFKEREHLQEWIAKCPTALGEELLIIQKEFDGFDETKERLDLLAIDKSGGLVVIENKLDDSGRDVVWQALKYASYCSSLSKSNIVEIYQDFLNKQKEGVDAKERISEFLEIDDFSEVILNSGIDQRVLLVAANFRREVTSTVLWLLQHGIRLQCIKATAFGQGEQIFLNLEQIIPTPEAADFMVGISEKEKEQQNTVQSLAKRERLRMDFWTEMLAALDQEGVSLFGNVSPSKDHWLNTGSGLSSVPYTMIFAHNEARVEMGMSRSSQAENKWIFDQLLERKGEIEGVFGEALEWQRMDDKKASRITCRKQFDGYDRESWPEMIEWLLVRIQNLEQAFHPELSKLGGQLKAGIQIGDEG